MFFRTLFGEKYNRLKISGFTESKQKSGTFRGEKRYFTTLKVPLFPSKSTALSENQFRL